MRWGCVYGLGCPRYLWGTFLVFHPPVFTDTFLHEHHTHPVKQNNKKHSLHYVCNLMYDTVQNFRVSKFLFLKIVTYTHQDCIYLIINTVKTVMLWSILLYFKIQFIPVIKSEFSASLLQSSAWSFRNHSNTVIWSSKKLLTSMLKTVVLLKFFVETVIHFFKIRMKFQTNSIYLK